MFIFNVQCAILSAIHIPRQELSAVLHTTDQFIRQSFYIIIDDGSIRPQNVRVSGCHNNIVDLIEFRVFVGLNDGD
jgi:hypothetical protein